MNDHSDRAPDDALENHPLRDTQEFESIRSRKASTGEPRPGTAGAVGGVGGALAGAGVGTIVAGPVGAIAGAIAGALGGWWAGQAASDTTACITPEDDTRYRTLYDKQYSLETDRFINPGEAFTPDLPTAKVSVPVRSDSSL